MKRIILYFVLLLFAPVTAKAQVLIGADVPPQPFSLLEIVADYTKGGFRLPQLDTDDIASLEQLISGLPAADRLKADGLMVLNKQTLCVEYWRTDQFTSLCGDMAGNTGQAEMDISCDHFVIYPNNNNGVPTGYREGVTIEGSSSFIKTTVTVTNPGTYSLVAATGNGYSFATSGVFLDTGDHLLTLPGQGTPAYGANGYADNLRIIVNGIEQTACNAELANKIPVAPETDPAVFTVTCEGVEVNGTYIAGNALGPDNYITVPVDVTAAGKYDFTVKAMYDSTTENGYFFAGDGEFAHTGNQTVTLYAQGTPTQVHSNANDATVGDFIVMTYGGSTLQCSNMVIPVVPPLANYSIDCDSYTVNGVYTVAPDEENSDDDPTHYIEIAVNVSNVSAASGWFASTDKASGLAFKGAGTFTANGAQTIKLYAVPGSKVTVYAPIELILTAETAGGSTNCSVIVNPVYHRIMIAGLGNTNNGYGYCGNASASRGFLCSSHNFGSLPESTVKMITGGSEGVPPPSGSAVVMQNRLYDYNAFDYVYYGALNATNLNNAIAAKPDIIIMGYDHSWNAALAATALAYLNSGGIILDFLGEGGAVADEMLKAILGVNNITSATAASIYTTLANIAGDPILEGPFQPSGATTLAGLNLAGSVENSLRGYINLPPDKVVVYGTNSNGNPVVFRTLEKNYVVFGDGGFLANDDNGSYLSNITEPFATSNDDRDGLYLPKMRPATVNYPNGVYNAFFFGNLIHWAIEQARLNGVNAE